MCLFAVAFRSVPQCPLLVLANRDELRSRPSVPPRLMLCDAGSAWMGGVDQVAGGTWLGLNQHGLVVAVTNRPKANPPKEPRSRGLLCRDLLSASTASAALSSALHQLQAADFDGVNVLLFSAAEAIAIEAADDVSASRLQPGVHAVTNGNLDDECDERLAFARRSLQTVVGAGGSLDERVEAVRRLASCGANEGRPALCLPGEERGTVASTVLAVTEHPGRVVYLHAHGPPDATPFADYSADARRLLSGEVDLCDVRPGRPDDDAYRIHLHGPWQVELNGGRATRVKLPAEWRTLFGDAAGRAVFRRRFQRPGRLDDYERVSLAFECIGGAASISLNETTLTSGAFENRTLECDVTGLLQPTNELRLQLNFDPQRARVERPGGVYGAVALAIRSR